MNLPIVAAWDYELVMLSVAIAMIGSYVALDFASRMRRAQGFWRRTWFMAGAFCMGLAIWSMHFIGILALVMPVSVSYNPMLSALSMISAAVGAGVAFWLMNRPSLSGFRLVAGAVAMGLAIVMMHYIGMASMQMTVSIDYNPVLVGLSVLIAVNASAGALWLAFNLKHETSLSWFFQKVGSALIMGAAIAGMNYTGMAAASYRYHPTPFVPKPGTTVIMAGWSMFDLVILASILFSLALLVLNYLNARERQQALEALVESEARFRNLADSAPVLIGVMDEDTEAVYFNKTFLAFTGCGFDRLKGQRWIERIHPNDRQSFIQQYLGAIDQRADFRTESRWLHHDGAYRWMLAVGKPRWLQNNVFGGYCATFTDITDQKHAEEQLKIYAAKLEKSNRELEDFTAIASHDLQSPLRKVMMHSDALAMALAHPLDAGDVQRHVDRIQRAVVRMQALITDLLTLSRVNRKPKPFQKIDLAQLIGEVVGDLESLIHQKQAHIEVLPLPWVEADPAQMKQLFQNLIENALKFQQPDQQPQIRITSDPLDSRICQIDVQDNGIGFDEKYLDKIFQVFERLHNDAQYPGTGIGLSTCQKIVERHGGTITAASNPGQGSRFSIRLPYIQAQPLTLNAEACMR